jgi:predicted nucleic acid-binding protein
MTLVADTGALYALYDAGDRHHRRVRAAIEAETGPIVVPAAVLPELDYLLREFLGVDAELDFLDGLLAGAFALDPELERDLPRCRELIAAYRDLDLGLVDSAVIATAERLGTQRILTVDERDFRAVRSGAGKPFVLLPADR